MVFRELKVQFFCLKLEINFVGIFALLFYQPNYLTSRRAQDYLELIRSTWTREF